MTEGQPSSGPDGSASETTIAALRRANDLLRADLEIARADLETLQRSVRPHSRARRVKDAILRGLARTDEHVVGLLGPHGAVVAGHADTDSDATADLLRAAAAADAATIRSFSDQPLSSPVLDAYRRGSQRFFAAGVRGYRRVRQLRTPR